MMALAATLTPNDSTKRMTPSAINASMWNGWFASRNSEAMTLGRV